MASLRCIWGSGSLWFESETFYTLCVCVCVLFIRVQSYSQQAELEGQHKARGQRGLLHTGFLTQGWTKRPINSEKSTYRLDFLFLIFLLKVATLFYPHALLQPASLMWYLTHHVRENSSVPIFSSSCLTFANVTLQMVACWTKICLCYCKIVMILFDSIQTALI